MCNTTDKTKEFFMFSYFGILPIGLFNDKKDKGEFSEFPEYKYYVSYKCSYRAYLDVCRTIHYSYTSEDIKAKKEGWEKFEDLKTTFIERQIDLILKGINSIPDTESSFDNWHKELCDYMLVDNDNFKEKLEVKTEIKQLLFKHDDKNKKKYSFKYGMAQKWLNITIKNLLLAEDMFNGCTGYEALYHKRELFHVPVDKNILKAAKSDFKIKEYPESWSSWNKDNYKNFTKDLNKKIRDKNLCPLDWEHTAWMKYAE